MREKVHEITIDSAEKERLKAQEEFDRAVSQRERNIKGQFATPPKLAEDMVRLAKSLFAEIKHVRFLDPGVGTGVFFSALLRVYGYEAIDSATGFEIDEHLAEIAERLWSPFMLGIHRCDFTQAEPPADDCYKPNLIVCNPPYVRHHHLMPATKARLKRITSRLGFAVNGLTGLYVYFLLLADQWLAPGGAAVWIVPAEFLDVNYGQVLKHYLCNRVTTLRIHRFDPTYMQFRDALVTSVVVAFKKSLPSGNPYINLSSGENLQRPSFVRQVKRPSIGTAGKWSQYFAQTEIFPEVKQNHTISEIFFIKRGLATGSNSFFIIEESVASKLNLPKQFLRAILPGPRSIRSDVIEADKEGFPLGLTRLVLFDCPLPRSAISHVFPTLERYLREGERKGIDQLYLPRSRKPWYSQEKRPAAPILCTYMGRKKKGGRALRFIRNYSMATAHNVYLLLYPKEILTEAAKLEPKIIEEIFKYLQSVQNIEKLGRVYGGGLSKLEPRELGRLELPNNLRIMICHLSGKIHASGGQANLSLDEA